MTLFVSSEPPCSFIDHFPHHIMSSLRNAVKRITHKERSQPRARVHLGFLEKKLDYRKRSDHYHRKEYRIQSVKRKASMKNPDEFYFGMQNAAVQDGHHRKTDKARYKDSRDQIVADVVRVMKTQDVVHARMIKSRDAKKAQKLKEVLHFIGNSHSSTNKLRHTIFVDKGKATDFDPVQHFETVPELLGRAFNRPRSYALKAAAMKQMGHNGEEGNKEEPPTDQDLKKHAKMAKKAARQAANARSNAYEEMEALLKRAVAMERTEAQLLTERHVSGKGRKRKVKAAENGQPAQYMWRRKRSK